MRDQDRSVKPVDGGMVSRRSDFEGQPVGEAQNPPGKPSPPQIEGIVCRGEGEGQSGKGCRCPVQEEMS